MLGSINGHCEIVEYLLRSQVHPHLLALASDESTAFLLAFATDSKDLI